MLKRELYLSRIRGFYDSNLVKILVGIRRCGKSVILGQIMDELKERGVDRNHILYINFEFIEYEELQDYHRLNTYVKEHITDEKIHYVFLDEIQNVDCFEKVINSLRASHENISIFITGSNSKLLSEEISTVLSGRYVSFQIYPLNYREFTELTGYDSKNEETSLFNLILQYIIDTTGREFSAKNILAFLKNEGREVSSGTLYSYLDALGKALIVRKSIPV